MSKIVNGAKTVYYIVGAIGMVVSATILILFFHPKKKDIVEAAVDTAETLDEVINN